MNRQESRLGLIVVALGILYLLASLAYPLGDFKKPGPGFFPTAMAVLLILGGLRLALRASRQRETDQASQSKWDLSKIRNVLNVVLGTAIYLILMPAIGFLTTTFFFLVFMFKILGSRGWLATAAASAVISLVFYWFFIKVLLLTAPEGLFL